MTQNGQKIDTYASIKNFSQNFHKPDNNTSSSPSNDNSTLINSSTQSAKPATTLNTTTRIASSFQPSENPTHSPNTVSTTVPVTPKPNTPPSAFPSHTPTNPSTKPVSTTVPVTTKPNTPPSAFPSHTPTNLSTKPVPSTSTTTRVLPQTSISNPITRPVPPVPTPTTFHQPTSSGSDATKPVSNTTSTGWHRPVSSSFPSPAKETSSTSTSPTTVVPPISSVISHASTPIATDNKNSANISGKESSKLEALENKIEKLDGLENRISERLTNLENKLANLSNIETKLSKLEELADKLTTLDLITNKLDLLNLLVANTRNTVKNKLEESILPQINKINTIETKLIPLTQIDTIKSSVLEQNSKLSSGFQNFNNSLANMPDSEKIAKELVPTINRIITFMENNIDDWKAGLTDELKNTNGPRFEEIESKLAKLSILDTINSAVLKQNLESSTKLQSINNALAKISSSEDIDKKLSLTINQLTNEISNKLNDWKAGLTDELKNTNNAKLEGIESKLAKLSILDAILSAVSKPNSELSTNLQNINNSLTKLSNIENIVRNLSLSSNEVTNTISTKLDSWKGTLINDLNNTNNTKLEGIESKLAKLTVLDSILSAVSKPNSELSTNLQNINNSLAKLSLLDNIGNKLNDISYIKLNLAELVKTIDTFKQIESNQTVLKYTLSQIYGMVEGLNKQPLSNDTAIITGISNLTIQLNALTSTVSAMQTKLNSLSTPAHSTSTATNLTTTPSTNSIDIRKEISNLKQKITVSQTSFDRTINSSNKIIKWLLEIDCSFLNNNIDQNYIAQQKEVQDIMNCLLDKDDMRDFKNFTENYRNFYKLTKNIKNIEENRVYGTEQLNNKLRSLQIQLVNIANMPEYKFDNSVIKTIQSAREEIINAFLKRMDTIDTKAEKILEITIIKPEYGQMRQEELHQVLLKDDFDSELPEDVICKVVKSGYKDNLENKIIRAQVMINKG